MYHSFSPFSIADCRCMMTAASMSKNGNEKQLFQNRKTEKTFCWQVFFILETRAKLLYVMVNMWMWTEAAHRSQQILTQRRRSDPIPPLSLPLEAEYWPRHLDPRARSVPFTRTAIEQEQRRLQQAKEGRLTH